MAIMISAIGLKWDVAESRTSRLMSCCLPRHRGIQFAGGRLMSCCSPRHSSSNVLTASRHIGGYLGRGRHLGRGHLGHGQHTGTSKQCPFKGTMMARTDGHLYDGHLEATPEGAATPRMTIPVGWQPTALRQNVRKFASRHVTPEGAATPRMDIPAGWQPAATWQDVRKPSLSNVTPEGTATPRMTIPVGWQPAASWHDAHQQVNLLRVFAAGSSSIHDRILSFFSFLSDMPRTTCGCELYMYVYSVLSSEPVAKTPACRSRTLNLVVICYCIQCRTQSSVGCDRAPEQRQWHSNKGSNPTSPCSNRSSCLSQHSSPSNGNQTNVDCDRAPGQRQWHSNNGLTPITTCGRMHACVFFRYKVGGVNISQNGLNSTRNYTHMHGRKDNHSTHTNKCHIHKCQHISDRSNMDTCTGTTTMKHDILSILRTQQGPLDGCGWTIPRGAATLWMAIPTSWQLVADSLQWQGFSAIIGYLAQAFSTFPRGIFTRMLNQYPIYFGTSVTTLLLGLNFCSLLNSSIYLNLPVNFWSFLNISIYWNLLVNLWSFLNIGGAKDGATWSHAVFRMPLAGFSSRTVCFTMVNLRTMHSIREWRRFTWC